MRLKRLNSRENQIKSQAFAALHTKDMTNTMKRKLVSILELATASAQLTQEHVDNLLFDYIDSSTFRPGNNIDKFTEVYDLTKTADGRKELEARYTLKKALDSRVVYEKQDSYIWTRTSGVLTIGETYSEAIDFLLNPSKQALVEELEAELKAKLA
jgi:uncharacterized protein with NAD-binding domain and iron-sulfur cluster